MIRLTRARMGDEKMKRQQMPRKWREKGGDEDRNCDGGFRSET